MTDRPYDPEQPFDRASLAVELVTRLEAAGFTHATERRHGERVYTRAVDFKHPDTGERVPLDGVTVEVFTTVVAVGHAIEVRALGKDAIRVVAVFRHTDEHGKTKRRGLVKEARVFRTGTIEGIVDRSITRARKVWAKVLDRPCCRDCGCTTFESRKGNDVCARVCFALSKGDAMPHAG